jgi:hypothetical protein
MDVAGTNYPELQKEHGAERFQRGPKESKVCRWCAGCGKIADTEDREPWIDWERLPPGADAAVRMGLVKPLPCPECGGTGTR